MFPRWEHPVRSEQTVSPLRAHRLTSHASRTKRRLKRLKRLFSFSANAQNGGSNTKVSRTISLAFDDATAIDNMQVVNEIANQAIYNLSGQRVAQPTKGLYIVNGKKVIIK